MVETRPISRCAHANCKRRRKRPAKIERRRAASGRCGHRPHFAGGSERGAEGLSAQMAFELREDYSTSSRNATGWEAIKKCGQGKRGPVAKLIRYTLATVCCAASLG